jgi:Flp pilus assembly pilin Flp
MEGGGEIRPRPATGESSMQRAILALRRLASTEDGQDLIEYAMLVVLIAVASVIAVGSVGTASANLWQTIAAQSF